MCGCNSGGKDAERSDLDDAVTTPVKAFRVVLMPASTHPNGKELTVEVSSEFGRTIADALIIARKRCQGRADGDTGDFKALEDMLLWEIQQDGAAGKERVIGYHVRERLLACGGHLYYTDRYLHKRLVRIIELAESVGSTENGKSDGR
jgi:hypothetical protein